MNRCDAFEDKLVDLHYGLLDQKEAGACRAHVADCVECAGRLEELGNLLGALRVGEAFPRESDVDWGAFRVSTVRRALAGRRGWLAALLPGMRLPVAPAWAAAAVLVAAGGLALMAYGLLPPGGKAPGPEPVASVHVPEDNLDNLTVNLARQNTARYLKETQAVLVTLLDVNIECEKDHVDITAERQKAIELLRRQRLIAAELNRLPLARAQDVCDDLQSLLLEISTLADCTRDEEIRTLRDVVEKRQILVRMELLSQELARRGTINV